jgi:putative membrane protein insertion efficiency factor
MKKIALTLIRAYQLFLSPLLRPCCRFQPSCSAYAYQAIETFGFFKGSFLALKRLLRCNPFCKGGFDPVPTLNEHVKNNKNHKEKK